MPVVVVTINKVGTAGKKRNDEDTKNDIAYRCRLRPMVTRVPEKINKNLTTGMESMATRAATKFIRHLVPRKIAPAKAAVIQNVLPKRVRGYNDFNLVATISFFIIGNRDDVFF